MGLDLAAARPRLALRFPRLKSTCYRSRDDMRGLRSQIGIVRAMVADHYGHFGNHSCTSLS